MGSRGHGTERGWPVMMIVVAVLLSPVLILLDVAKKNK